MLRFADCHIPDVSPRPCNFRTPLLSAVLISAELSSFTSSRGVRWWNTDFCVCLRGPTDMFVGIMLTRFVYTVI